jgi:hypothetical protein
LSAMWFDPLVMTSDALEEPACSDARASEQRLAVLRSVSCSWPATQDQILVLGLTLRSVMPVDGLISNDNAVWRRVVSSFMRTLARCVLLTAEVLSRAWFDC